MMKFKGKKVGNRCEVKEILQKERKVGDKRRMSVIGEGKKKKVDISVGECESE